MVAQQNLRVDLAVQKYMDELLDAASLADLGDALARLSETFALSHLTIFEAVKPAAIYPRPARDNGERPDELPSPHLHAVLAFVRAADQPVTLDDVRRGVSPGGDDWLRLAPGWLRREGGMMLSVPSRARNAWCFVFRGQGQSCGVARAALHVAAELAFRRHEELAQVAVNTAPLTGRERQVMRLLSSGRTDGEAALTLNISARTVRFHVDNAKRKLGVSSRAQAVVQSLRARQSVHLPVGDGLEDTWPVEEQGKLE